MLNLEKTILSQFANSPILMQLIQNMNSYIDPSSNIDAFYNLIWNVNTAQGVGLDVWGRIVNVDRTLQVIVPPENFGFYDGLNDYFPFGDRPFYNGPDSTSAYVLADDLYRKLIMAKALANISATTAPAINQLLTNLFAGRGRCYVSDLGNMQMRYTFEFNLLPYERAMVTSSHVLPHPAGVSVSVLEIDIANTFGFAEANSANSRIGINFTLGISVFGCSIGTGNLQTFNNGTFITY